jgi:small-conductance mechanosensitive channel
MFIWGMSFKNLWILISGILGFFGIALFASWSYLSNVFSAFVLFFSVPYKISDKVTVTDGQINLSGTIKDMTLFYVFLKDEDGNSISIPNNIILQKVVKRHLSNNESFSNVESHEFAKLYD